MRFRLLALGLSSLARFHRSPELREELDSLAQEVRDLDSPLRRGPDGPAQAQDARGGRSETPSSR